MFVLDTNILVYAADRDSEAHERCQRLIGGWRAGRIPWFTTWPILYEFLRVTTHPRVFRTPWKLGEAWGFVTALLEGSLEILSPTAKHEAVAAAVFEEISDLRGNLLHDAHTAILMREHGVREIRTRDTDFHRFPFLHVVDPLA